MIGHRAIVGLSLLSALMFCAFAAQSASAAKSTSTTFFTCVNVGKDKGDFEDAHCDNKVSPNKGEFAHEAIAADSGTTTGLEVTNNKVTPGEKGEPTAKSEPAVLKSKVTGGAKATVECTTIKAATKVNEKTKEVESLSTIHNVTTEVEGKKLHTATGEAVVDYSNCNVKELLKCVVAEPIRTEANVTGLEKLGKAENEMGLEFAGKGAEETFATLEFLNKGAEKCSVNTQKFKAKGSVIATSGPTTESVQTNNNAGATLVFTPKFEMEKLKLGPEPAEFTTINTTTMFGGGNPISMTTVTT
jgi:hypothetical protein